MKLRKLIIPLTLTVLSMSIVTTSVAAKALDKKQSQTSKAIDPDKTDPNDPTAPGPGDDEWVMVSLPTTLTYRSAASSQHKNIVSDTRSIVNQSNYPVKVGLSGYTKIGSGTPDITGISTLKIEGTPTPISLVSGGVASTFNSSNKMAQVFELGAGGPTPATGSFNGPNKGEFKFSGTTDSAVDLTQNHKLMNELQFTLIPLDGDGREGVRGYRVDISGNDTSDLFPGDTRDFSASVIQTWNGNDDRPAPDQTIDWSVSGNTDATTTFNGKSLSIGANETATSLTLKARSALYNEEADLSVKVLNITYDIQFDSANDLKAMEAGTSRTFKAEQIKSINGTAQALDPALQDLKWSVKKKSGSLSSGITIDEKSGELTVARLESDQTVIITATSPSTGATASFDLDISSIFIFANQKWDIIKDFGNGAKLIAMQNSIGNTSFNNGTTSSSPYYEQDNDVWDGYQITNKGSSKPKAMLDNWYYNNIKGTGYEASVLPVVLNNPTLGDMKTGIYGGWSSNTVGNSISGFLAVNQPNAFPTEIDTTKGLKQAFLMSGSDVSNGQGTLGDLTPEALVHRNKLSANSVMSSWLRSPGYESNYAARLDSGTTSVYYTHVHNANDVVPSLVVSLNYNVKVTGGSTEVELGQSSTPFKGEVFENFDDVDTPTKETITWTVTGGSKTYPSVTGDTFTLSVPTDETADELTITATPPANFINKTPWTQKVKVDKTIIFATHKWSVLKDFGNGAKLIAKQDKIGTSAFSKTMYYYSTNDDNLDGYQDSLVKPLVDTWYDNNIKGTDYEASVLPVVLNNPTLGDMKTLGGWSSNTVGNSTQSFLAVNQPNAFPTVIDITKGSKQAFLMSGSDVSNGLGTLGDLTSAALAYSKKLAANGIRYFNLRSPGRYFDEAAGYGSSYPEVAYDYVGRDNDIVPALIVSSNYRVELISAPTEVEVGELSKEFKGEVIESFDGIDIPSKEAITWTVTGGSKTYPSVTGDTFTLDVPSDETASELTVTATPPANFINVTPKIQKVKIIKPDVPVTNPDGSVEFANERWDVIKDYGNGDKLIAMERKIGNSRFSRSSNYYSTNDDNLDGYQDSTVKSIVDTWYDSNIKGTDYEASVLPVVLNNPTLGDMKKFGGWNSNTSGSSISGFLAVNQPDAFPTEIDTTKGLKQAFLMSGSDVSNGKGTQGDLTPEALVHRDNLAANSGTSSAWLRSPADYYFTGSSLYTGNTYVNSNSVSSGTLIVVPSLIVHIP